MYSTLPGGVVGLSSSAGRNPAPCCSMSRRRSPLPPAPQEWIWLLLAAMMLLLSLRRGVRSLYNQVS